MVFVIFYVFLYSCLFFVFSPGKPAEKFEEHRTIEKMSAFLRSKVEGKERDNRIDQVKWEDLPSSVEHLNEQTFQGFVDRTEHALVAFHVRCKFPLPRCFHFSFTLD